MAKCNQLTCLAFKGLRSFAKFVANTIPGNDELLVEITFKMTKLSA